MRADELKPPTAKPPKLHGTSNDPLMGAAKNPLLSQWPSFLTYNLKDCVIYPQTYDLKLWILATIRKHIKGESKNNLKINVIQAREHTSYKSIPASDKVWTLKPLLLSSISNDNNAHGLKRFLARREFRKPEVKYRTSGTQCSQRDSTFWSRQPGQLSQVYPSLTQQL